MAAKDVLEVFGELPHTEENWKKAWSLMRKGTALETHDVELVAASDEEIVLRMEVGDHARQPYGLLHGGISMMLAETAASMHSTWGLDLTRVPVGIEINGSHLRSATEGAVLAVGKVLRRGSTLIHHEVRIVEEKSRRELSVIRVTNMLIKRRA